MNAVQTSHECCADQSRMLCKAVMNAVKISHECCAGEEVMYVRKRLGFVKLALQHGAHLLPAFAFGQSDTYS